jgi:ankyrin repeat protein
MLNYDEVVKKFEEDVKEEEVEEEEVKQEEVKQKVSADDFLKACKKYCNIEVVKNYIKNGGDVNIKDENGSTALVCACYENNEEIVEMLLNAKCDVNAKSAYGRTALMNAVLYNNEKIIEMLLNAKCDVNARDNFGAVAFTMASKEKIQNMLKKAIIK